MPTALGIVRSQGVERTLSDRIATSQFDPISGSQTRRLNTQRVEKRATTR
jgi:hypothetical protein